MTEKDALIFVEHILDSMKNIEDFTKGVPKESFMKNKEKQSAVIRQIEVIGEASKNLSDGFRSKYPQVSWKEIIGARDKIIHHYFGVDLEIVWEIITINLPVLKKQMQEIRKDLEETEK